MQRGFVILSVTVGATLFLGTARFGGFDSGRTGEAVRLERHFDSVDVELKSQSVATLTSSQNARRQLLIGWLREYRNAGSFPKNDRFAKAIPFFRDSNGTLCAMAYLIDRSGRTDIVEKVAATRNNAYIAELADDPALIAWLDSAGLTVAEAARIQPAYGGLPTQGDLNQRVESDIALAGLGLSSASLATSAVNVVKPSFASGLLGLVVGGASIWYGAENRDQNSGTDKVANATIALGAVSMAAGIYGLFEAREKEGNRARDHDDDRRRRRRGGGRRGMSMTVSPDLAVRSEEPRMGLRFNAQF